MTHIRSGCSKFIILGTEKFAAHKKLTRVVYLNAVHILNLDLDPDPGFRANLDPDPGLCYQF